VQSTTITTDAVRLLAGSAGFQLAGVAPAVPLHDSERYQAWVKAGYAAEMRYLTDHRADKRNDPRSLLASARSVICVGMLYNGPEPYSLNFNEVDRAWISRYAWGEDYHEIVKVRLEELVGKLLQIKRFEYKICVDTAPLLERSYARQAGLGWIGKNTCLIHEGQGSWFFLGEVLTSLDLAPGQPPPDRCGTCTRCLDACPTQAIVPAGDHFTIDSRLCISYFTIELRAEIPLEQRTQIGNHVFGCDICQDVCPWNRRAPLTEQAPFAPRQFAPPLEDLSRLTEAEFRRMFHATPVSRARYSGFLRNVAVAMGNQRNPRFRDALTRMAASPDPLVAQHAQWALEQLSAQ
jgi:epoxyqueuosine reductase